MARYPSATATSQGLSDAVFSQLAARARNHVGTLYPLHVGDTSMEPMEVARVQMLGAEAHRGLHAYAPVQGEPTLIDAFVRKIERRHGVALDRDCVQVMSGATAALGVVANAVLDAGDELILPSPFWPLIRGVTRARGAVPVEVPFYPRLGEPDFDLEATLEAAIGPRTVALYINSPHNPTGTALSDEAIDVIARVVERHDLWLLSDEVYEDVYYAEPPRPVWRHPRLRERSIVTHSMSKAYAMAGARIGFTHGPASVMSTIRGMQTFYTYCAPRPLQFAAARALNEGDAWLGQMRAHNERCARIASEALGLPMPSGGTFLFMDVAPYLRSAESAQDLLGRCLDAGVLLTPGSACGSDFENWARLCFTVVPEPALQDAMQRLRAVLLG